MSNFKYFLGTMPITHSHLDISIPSETLVLLKELLSLFINPFNASRSKLLLFEGFSAIYWSNPQLLIFDIRALWRPGLSARAPECQKLKIVG